MFASVIINGRSARRLKEGYPWIYERDVISRRFSTAGIVGVTDKRGKFLGQAFYSPSSKIVLRLITRSKEKIGAEFWAGRIGSALKKRRHDVTNAFRAVYAESDGIPSIVIDKYNDIAAFQITSAGAEAVKDDIVKAIAGALHPAAIIEKDDTDVRLREGLKKIERVVYGDKAATNVTEGDQQFEVDVLHGQKTGAYLDYRAFRLKAAELCKGLALDLFCYQGWLACQIAGAEAHKIVAVDSSREAIKAARRNAKLNGHENIEFVCADAFEFLAHCGEKFDFIHCDPPPFAKGRENLPAAVKGYNKLYLAAMKLLRPGGIFFTSSCSHHISEGLLEKMVLDCVKALGLKCEVVYRGVQDKDHPILKGFPESLYLKAIAISRNF